MRSVWVMLAGRTGSVLLVLGFCLALVSVIPPAPAEHIFSWGFDLGPGQYKVCPVSRVQSPKTGFRTSVTSEGGLQLYLLGTHRLQILQWIMSWAAPKIPDLEKGPLLEDDPRLGDVSFLRAYAETHPEEILLNRTAVGPWQVDFFPPTVTNVTVVILNPSSSLAENVQVEMKGITAVAPKERVAISGTLLVFSGIVLVAPQLALRALGHLG